MFSKKNFFRFFVFFGILFLAGSDVRAIEYGQIGGRPANPDPAVEESKSWFIYSLEPGKEKQDSLLVVNMSDEPLEALIYAADSVRSSSGGFALRQQAEPKEGIGLWVRFYPDQYPDFAAKVFEGRTIPEACAFGAQDLEEDFSLDAAQRESLSVWCQGKQEVEVSLEGSAKKELPFVITIPDKVEVGEHTGGILIQKKQPQQQDSADGSRVTLTTRVGVRIYQTVPGEVVRNLSFGEIEVRKNFHEFYFPGDKQGEMKFGEYLINSSIENSGNVSVEFSEKIKIRNILTGRVEEVGGRTFQVLRADKFISTLSWKAPRFGYLSFSKEYSYVGADGKENVSVSGEVRKLVLPWRESVWTILAISVFAAIYALWRIRMRKLYGGAGWARYEVKGSDSLVKLIELSGVSWDVFVRTNKLKPPYQLSEGQLILVPPSLGHLCSQEYEERTGEAEVAVRDAGVVKSGLSGENSIPACEDGIIVEEKQNSKTGNSKRSGEMKRPKKDMPNSHILERISQKNAVLTEEKEKSFSVAAKSGNFSFKKVPIYVWLMGFFLVLLSLAVLVLFANYKSLEKEYKEGKISDSSIKNLSIAPSASETSAESSGKEEGAAKQEERGTEIEDSAGEGVLQKDIAESEILVLNGGATPGSAGKVAEFLKGYSLQAKAENAEEQSHEGVGIYYREEFAEAAQAVADLLAKEYPLAQTALAVESEQQKADVVVILGR